MSPWLVEAPGAVGPARRVVCVPFAGGGPSLFEPWRRVMRSTSVTSVRLPGREGRFREPALTDVDAVVDELAPAVAARASSSRGVPWAIFGYSLGALIAYELVVRLAADGYPVPGVLVVGGAEPPHVPREVPPVSWLSDAEFTEAVRRMGGTSAEVFEHPELLALLLPTVRADFRLVESYRPRDHPPLPCPIVTYRGDADDEVDPDTVAKWGELTSAAITHHTIPGGHFSISERPEEFAGRVSADLDRFLGH